MAEGLASSVIPRDPPRHAHLVMCRAQNGAPVPKLSPHVQNYNFSGLAKLSPRGLDFGTQRYLEYLSCRFILVERARGPPHRALAHALWLLELAPPLLSRGALPRQCGIRTTNALDLFAYEVKEE